MAPTRGKSIDDVYEHLDHVLDRLQSIESGMGRAERHSHRRINTMEPNDTTQVQGITSDAFQLQAAQNSFNFRLIPCFIQDLCRRLQQHPRPP